MRRPVWHAGPDKVLRAVQRKRGVQRAAGRHRAKHAGDELGSDERGGELCIQGASRIYCDTIHNVSITARQARP